MVAQYQTRRDQMPEIDPRIRQRAAELLQVVNNDYALVGSEKLNLSTPGLDFTTEARFVASAGKIAEKRLLRSELLVELADELEDAEHIEREDMKRKQPTPGWDLHSLQQPAHRAGEAPKAKPAPTKAAKAPPISAQDFIKAASAYDSKTGPASVRKRLEELRRLSQQQAERYLSGGGSPIVSKKGGK
jgi:hypothetical protein